jgi:hypothetical protein
VKLHAPLPNRTADACSTPTDEHSCLLELATDSFTLAVPVIGMLNVNFEVESPPELAENLRKLSRRFATADGVSIRQHQTQPATQ